MRFFFGFYSILSCSAERPFYVLHFRLSLWRNPLPPTPWNLSMLTFYTCKCSYVCTEEVKTKMIRILTVPPFFPSIKLPWNYLNRRKKVNVMVIVPGFFFCYYAHSYWILVKTKIRKNGQILEAVCILIRDWRNWFSKNCWIHISQCNNFVFLSHGVKTFK